MAGDGPVSECPGVTASGLAMFRYAGVEPVAPNGEGWPGLWPRALQYAA